MQKPAIGIDLGTTYSSIAVCKNGETEVILNDQGDRVTPSCVTFTKSRKFFGEGAVRQAVENAENSIYGVKRIIGRSYNNPVVQEEMKSWPFKLIEDNNAIKIQVTFKEKLEHFSPQEISSMILENLKTSAEEYLATEIKDVVITCPANFNDSQRHATMEAAKIAGLNVIRMINEPTAAALAYGLMAESNIRKNILVFDFGGGTCDISILTVKGNKFTVRGTKGDTHLGGEDFDKRLVDYFVEKLKKDTKEDIGKNKSFLRQVKIECEQSKKLLSFSSEVNQIFDNSKGLTGHITRARFEELCYDLFERAINLVDQTLNDAEMAKTEIDEVLLVGGSSRIPKVQEMLSEFFGRKISIKKEVNPEEAISIGAAIQAASIQNQLSGNMKGLKLCDVCPLYVGNLVCSGGLHVIIKRNTPLPASGTYIHCTGDDGQTGMTFKIYEGERVMAADNHFLGSFEIKGIPPKARREVKVELTYEIDENGILTVSAVERSSGNEASLVVKKDCRFNENETAFNMADIDKFREEDEIHRKRLMVFTSLLYYLLELDAQIKKITNKEKQKKVKEYIEASLKWLLLNKLESKETLESKQQEIKQNCEKYLLDD